MNDQEITDLPHGVSLHASEDDKIRHEAGHVILYWLIGNKPISVEYVEDGLVTNLEQIRNPNEQPWQHIMALLAGPIAENHNESLENDLLSELFEKLTEAKAEMNSYFFLGTDSYRIIDQLINIDFLMLVAGAYATSSILKECLELQEDFIRRFKINNRLNQDEIQEMFDHWNHIKQWTSEDKIEFLRTKYKAYNHTFLNPFPLTGTEEEQGGHID